MTWRSGLGGDAGAGPGLCCWARVVEMRPGAEGMSCWQAVLLPFMHYMLLILTADAKNIS